MANDQYGRIINPNLIIGLSETYGVSELIKGQNSDILEKGKAANVGETRNWNGKNYKKQPNGNWLEVSDHGLSKKEHNQKLVEMKERGARPHADKNDSREWENHTENRNNLSDKEHSDEEVGLGGEDIKHGDTFNHPKHGEIKYSHKIHGSEEEKPEDADYYFNNKADFKVKLSHKEVQSLSKKDKIKKSLFSEKFDELDNIFKSLTGEDDEDYLEKGGKRATVGEVRMYGGKKYVKHTDGWVYVGVDGTGKVYNGKISDANSKPAEKHHIDHHKEHVGRNERETSKVSGEKKDLSSMSFEEHENEIKRLQKIRNERYLENDKSTVEDKKVHDEAYEKQKEHIEHKNKILAKHLDSKLKRKEDYSKDSINFAGMDFKLSLDDSNNTLKFDNGKGSVYWAKTEESKQDFIKRAKESIEDDFKSLNKKEDSKSNKTNDSIRSWGGSHLKDEHIDSIKDALSEAGIEESDFNLQTKPVSQEHESDLIDKKVDGLRKMIRPGLEHADMSNEDVKDALHGMVRSKRDGMNVLETVKSQDFTKIDTEVLNTMLKNLGSATKQTDDNKKMIQSIGAELTKRSKSSGEDVKKKITNIVIENTTDNPYVDIINSDFEKWNKIKTDSEHSDWKKNVPKLGTHGTINIADFIESNKSTLKIKNSTAFSNYLKEMN